MQDGLVRDPSVIQYLTGVLQRLELSETGWRLLEST